MKRYLYVTPQGTPYLKEPGLVLLARPSFDRYGLVEFLRGFSTELEFVDFLEDVAIPSDAEELCKTAGQLCYMSFGPGRTKNADREKYLDHIKSSGHGSVLEHANVTFLFYGISRSVTHELVRHRAGFAFSQVSQRYVSGKVLRFVERPEYQQDESLHKAFEARIDMAAQEYDHLSTYLAKRQQEGSQLLTGDARTELRKKVQQCSRSLLPNETEAPIIVTANVRAWRHFLEMRASSAAEIEIRRLAYRAWEILVGLAPALFNDYKSVNLSDGTMALATEFRKV